MRAFPRPAAVVLVAARHGTIRPDGVDVVALYHQVKRHNIYAILSEWSSREEFTTFLQSDLFREVTDWGKASILAGRPRHEIYSSAEGSI